MDIGQFFFQNLVSLANSQISRVHSSVTFECKYWITFNEENGRTSKLQKCIVIVCSLKRLRSKFFHCPPDKCLSANLGCLSSFSVALFLIMSHSRPHFFNFVLSNVNSKYMCVLNFNFVMTRFEQLTSGVGSVLSTNWATITAQLAQFKMLFRLVIWFEWMVGFAAVSQSKYRHSRLSNPST